MSDQPLRHIPDTWFRATTHNTTMTSIMQKDDRFAPLTEGERKLGRFVLPPFQRPAVWTLAQKVRFIESAWMGLPIGVFIYNRTTNMHSPFDGWLLDGQQRVTTVLDYVADGFPVFGKLYSELTEADRRRWHMGTTFASMECNIEDEAQLREVYDRLAYGGTPHEPKEA